MVNSVDLSFQDFYLLGSEGYYKIQPIGGECYICVTDGNPDANKSFLVNDRQVFEIANNSNLNVYVKPAYSLAKSRLHLVYTTDNDEIAGGNGGGNNNNGGCDMTVLDKDVVVLNNCFNGNTLDAVLTEICNRLAPENLQNTLDSLRVDIDAVENSLNAMDDRVTDNENNIQTIFVQINSLDQRVTTLESRVDNLTSNTLFAMDATAHITVDTIVPEDECRIACDLIVDDNVTLDVRGKVIDLCIQP